MHFLTNKKSKHIFIRYKYKTQKNPTEIEVNS